MKPLIVLLVAFGSACLATYISKGTADHIFAGRLAMAAMLAFTAIAHFKFDKGMVMMLPTFIPFKLAVVYITGVAEVLLGSALLINPVRVPAACALIFFFVLLLPANIHAAQNKVNLENTTNDGSGLNYLWFRIPLQLFFIAWAYYFGLGN